MKQKSKYIYIESELNIKTIKFKQKRGSISEYCEFQIVLSHRATDKARKSVITH